jgi:putative selenate reductase
MAGNFSPISIHRLYLLLCISADNGEILGIPDNVFFKPANNEGMSGEFIGQMLETPLGVAAGPHTQMAQNIISAWLCGARYMELKTIQTLDELEVSKPCIDMQDEGYNCEWSQELKIHESFDEYLKAWILIHLLKHKFGWNEGKGPGTIFNMSVGYNMEGILKENVQWLFEKMKNCKAEKENMVGQLKALYPAMDKIEIPDRISDNVTLSTMHGCPPDEIEKIGRYLIEEKKLNTIIKLNPTMLGATELRKILNEQAGFRATVPDIAFEHDLKYDDAIAIIKSLQKRAAQNNVFFGIKLTNTLECKNHKNIFNEKEKMMYMSGRALHPISISLASKLQTEFKGDLNITFSAGADCFNIAELLKCGLYPVTVCSDILKPGGYGRLSQYIEEIQKDHHSPSIRSKMLENLNKYSEKVILDKKYHSQGFAVPSIKTQKKLNLFDCIAAPCVNTCPGNQNIPLYLYYTSLGEYAKAYQTIIETNPFPNVLGMVCDHLCQSKCTRINYDNSLLIREIKRFISEKHREVKQTYKKDKKNVKVSIIGAGPSGLSCAYFLARSGFEVNVFETKDIPGGMAADAIPSFRLSADSLKKDISNIEKLGVRIYYNSKITAATFEKLREEYKYIYVAVGAQQTKKMKIEGEDAEGILDPLLFLSEIRKGRFFDLGKKVAVIGGGNTAMDVARAVKRLLPEDGTVQLIYRRTVKEMPADEDEIKAVVREGIEIMELTAPEKIVAVNGRLRSLQCCRFELGETDQSGRSKPVRIESSEFVIDFDTVIPAIGQDIVVDFLSKEQSATDPLTFETKISNVYIGGDALRGPKNIITAVADGRKVADNILRTAHLNLPDHKEDAQKGFSRSELLYKRSRRQYGNDINDRNRQMSGDLTRNDFVLIDTEARQEAARCLFCDEICNICVTVCPNRANHSYSVIPLSYQLQKAVKRTDGSIVFEEDRLFSITQPYQVVNISDFCNECGNCTTFCPTAGAPFSDKPRIFLTKEGFAKADSGYYLIKGNKQTIINYKFQNQIKTLTLLDQTYVFETDSLLAKINAVDFRLKEVRIKDTDISEAGFTEAAEMSVLMKLSESLFDRQSFYVND